MILSLFLNPSALYIALHNSFCVAVERRMTEVTLRAVHPVETKEVASLSARFLTTTVIAASGILLLIPFVVYSVGH
jgi:hypothetical protein